MMQLEPHYYEITVTEDMLLRIDGESLGNLYIILYKNNQRYYLDELYLEQWYPSYINLTPGTYSIKVFSRSSSIDNYAITFRNGNNIQSNFSLDKENPTEINSESDMTYYVSNFLDPFYQEITITEPTMINGWFENIMLLNVYKDNTIIEQHNAEVSDILPIVLEPGTYLFEYYSFENGVVFAEELFFTPIHYSPGTMTAPTQVEGFRLFEVINDQNPMQAYEITITEDGIYDVEAWSDDYFEYFIVDSNNNTVCNEDYMNSLMYLEEGTYTLYIHQPHQSEFVNLYISNKTRLLASETITNTVLIPEGNEFRFIIDTEVTNYLRLRVVDETYLDIDVYGFTYEVLDSIGNVVDYTNLDFGTYVIKITPLSETITSNYQYVDITIRNIKGYTFDNTIATAKEIEFTKTYSGMITDPLEQHWYTFTLDSRDAVYISGQGYNASIELYDASENLISTENHHYYFLDAATYYIRVLDSEETYILTVSNKHYNDIPNTFTEAQEINIFNNFNYQTYLEDSNDVDYYTFTLTEDKLLYFWYDFNTFDLYDGTQTHIKTLSAYSYNVLPQGQYYIKVSGQQYPYYSIGITDRTDMLPGDSKTNAMEIKLDDTIYVFERDDTTNDFFYFDLIVDTNIYLSGVSDIYLYDESDNLITDYNLTAGRYYIHVDSVYTETYNLRVGTYIYEGEQIADDIDAPSTNPIRINTEVFYFFYHITDMLEKDHFVTILEENTCIYFDGDGVVINVYDSANNIVIANENIYDINCLSTGEYTIIFEAEENDTEYWIEYYELDHLDLSIDENNPTIYHEYEIIDTYINSTNPIYLEVTITNEKVFYVDINGNAYVEIYTTDSNPEKLFGSDINTFFHAIPGTYTIIIIPMDSTELRFHLNDTMDTILPEDIT